MSQWNPVTEIHGVHVSQRVWLTNTVTGYPQNTVCINWTFVQTAM